MNTPDTIARLNAALEGRYRIESELGAGGMATVYLAEDLKHHRKVAVKVLRPELAAALGAERFLNEIGVTANLQHPHILPLFDSGDSDGFLFYVMPLVEGESLADKLQRERQLPIEESVDIARQVAAALEYAHKRGVVHRDIKPDNIMLSSGEAIVADFGIARAIDAAGGEQLTVTGAAMGTPAYMSPEQAAGDQELDARSDVYALGCVLYEMLAGEPPFTGNSVQALIAKRLTEPAPSIATLRDTVPRTVSEGVARALARAPADRFDSAASFAAALTSGQPVTIKAADGLSLPPQRAVLLGLAIALVIAVVLLLMPRDQTPTLTLGRATAVTSEDGLEIHPAISPDGNLVAFASGSPTRVQVFVRPVGGGRMIRLTDDTLSLQMHPRWSPDGSEILFVSDTSLQVAPALGGRQRTVVPADGQEIETADWSPDGSQVVFTRGDSIHVLSLANNQVQVVAPDSASLHSCAWSPEDPILACVAGNYGNVGVTQANYGNLAPSRIVLVSMETGSYHSITDGTTMDQSPAWGPSGRVLYFVSNRQGPRDIYATAISRDMVSGGFARQTTGLDAQSVHLSRDGRRLAYSDYVARANLWSLPVPDDGPVSVDDATPLTTGNQIVETMMLSYDREWLVFDSDLRGNADIYRIPAEGGTPEQLTRAPFDEFSGGLSPDGTELTYHTWESGSRDIAVQTLAGGISTLITATPGQESYPVWSPDGSWILFYDQGSSPMAYVIERTGDGGWDEPLPVLANLFQPVWSWDGQFLAGLVEPDGVVIVMGFPDGDVREVYRPGADGDPRPRSSVHWSVDGATLFFKSHDVNGSASLWSVPIEGGRPRMLVTFGDHESARGDFSTDGTHFYFTIEDRQSDIWVMEVGDTPR